MNIDYDYIEKILEIFLQSTLPTANWNDFEPLRKGDEHKFVFHMEILADKNLVEGALKDKSMGISRTYNDYVIAVIPWRLTASGHDFALSLTKPGVLATIKEKFKTEGLSVVIDIAKQIASKKAEKLLGE
jgi:hypothetical protein